MTVVAIETCSGDPVDTVNDVFYQCDNSDKTDTVERTDTYERLKSFRSSTSFDRTHHCHPVLIILSKL